VPHGTRARHKSAPDYVVVRSRFGAQSCARPYNICLVTSTDIFMSLRKLLSGHWLVIPIVILAALILSYHIDKPFVGHHDWNSVWFGAIARNHLRYGLLVTKLGQVQNYGPYKNPKELGFHTHHPLLIPLLVATSFSIFGESEAAERLIPVIASLGMVALIYFIGQKLFNRKVGLLASIFTIITPIFIYFGKLPVHETVVPAFVLMAFYFYMYWFTTGKTFFFKGMLITLIIAQLTGWAGYYIVPFLVLHTLFFKLSSPSPKNSGLTEWKRIFLLIPLSVGMFVLYLVHVKILTGSFVGGGLLWVFSFRFNPEASAGLYGFSYLKFIVQESRFMVIYFTKILTIASLAWIGISGWKILMSKGNWWQFRRESFLLLLLLWGITHMLIFRNLSFIHDYMIYYLLPFISLSSAIVVCAVWKKMPRKYLGVIFLFLVVSLTATERLPFVTTLLETNEAEKGRQVGMIMRQYSDPYDTSFITSNNFREFFDVFVGFYADRRANYGESLPKNFSQDYRLVIRPLVHDALPEEQKEFLDANYVRQENDSAIWYDLKHPLPTQ